MKEDLIGAAFGVAFILTLIFIFGHTTTYGVNTRSEMIEMFNSFETPTTTSTTTILAF